MMKIFLIIIICLLSLLFLFFLCCFLLSLIFFIKGFKRKNVDEYKRIIYDDKKENYYWLDNLNPIDVSINSFVNTKLAAKYLKNEDNHLYVITLHGYHGMYISRMPIVKEIYKKYKCSILAINFRGHYTSEGKYNSLGYLESKDLIEWVNHIINEDKEAKIILDGVSMGAFTILHSLGDLNNKNVIGAICDCGYYSLYDQMKNEYYKVNKYVAPFALMFLPMLFKLRYKVSIKTINNKESLSRTNIPTFLIHAKDDDVVPFKNLALNVNSFNKNVYVKQLIFEDGKHARTFYKHKDIYKREMFGFLDKIIN